jgi:hypothetical protein
MADLQEEIGALGLDRPMETLAGVQPVQNRIIVISGFRGSGKTTVAARILRAQLRLIVYDPHEDEAYGDWIPNTVHSVEGKRGLREYFRWASREKKLAWAIRYVPEDGDLGQDADEFCSFIFRTVRHCWVAFEEVHQLAQTPSPSSMPPHLRKLVNRGRHRKISMAFTGIRYSEIPRPITAGANFHIVFRTAEPGDREQLVNRIGTEATDAVANLGAHEAVLFDTFTRKFTQINSRDANIGLSENSETAS